MQGKKIVLVIYAVLTMEDFLEGELLIFIYRQKRSVDVRIFLIAVDGKILFQRGYWDKLSFLKQHNLPIE